MRALFYKEIYADDEALKIVAYEKLYSGKNSGKNRVVT